MYERLTNDEIRDLPSLGIRGGPTYPISCRAQTMIRELQDEIRRLLEEMWELRKVSGQAVHDFGSRATELQIKVEFLKADNAKLKADADVLRGAIHHKDSEYIDACGELDELESENTKLRERCRLLKECHDQGTQMLEKQCTANGELEAENTSLRDRAHGWYACYKEVQERNTKLWEALNLLINCPAMADARALLVRKEAVLKRDDNE